MGTLHVVATPIGNLEDVTLRALRVLREADLVLAEDTRHTRVLLARHGIDAKLVSLHAHNEAARCERALEVLDAGGAVALCSDAGTPLLSDPGARLVAAAVAAGHAASPVPGRPRSRPRCAWPDLDAARFSFVGFLPRRAGERRARLAELAARPDALVFFESPRRVGATLRELAAVLGDAARLRRARADQAPRGGGARHALRAGRALRRGRARRGHAGGGGRAGGRASATAAAARTSTRRSARGSRSARACGRSRRRCPPPAGFRGVCSTRGRWRCETLAQPLRRAPSGRAD